MTYLCAVPGGGWGQCWPNIVLFSRFCSFSPGFNLFLSWIWMVWICWPTTKYAYGIYLMMFSLPWWLKPEQSTAMDRGQPRESASVTIPPLKIPQSRRRGPRPVAAPSTALAVSKQWRPVTVLWRWRWRPVSHCVTHHNIPRVWIISSLWMIWFWLFRNEDGVVMFNRYVDHVQWCEKKKQKPGAVFSAQ